MESAVDEIARMEDPMLKRLMLSLAIAVPALVGSAAITTPAEAHYTGYAHKHGYKPMRHRCWTERQRVRVWGPHGRHFVWRSVRVCR